MTLSEITNRPIAVNCTTESDADTFLKMCEDAGIFWVTGEPPTLENCWNPYKERICYDIEKNKLSVSDIAWYSANNYTIINFNEITE